jgi:hypothetical protein
MGVIQLKTSLESNESETSGMTLASSRESGAGGGGYFGLTKGIEWYLHDRQRDAHARTVKGQ